MQRLFFLLVAATSSHAKHSLDVSWPKEMPAGVSYFTAVSSDASSGVVHVLARMNTSHPILTFSDDGEFLYGWGEKDMSFDDDGGVWGGHGMALEVDGRAWVADILDHTAKVFEDRTLVAMAGTQGQEGSDVDRLQFGSTADIATGTGVFEGSAWVSDGDGGINDRVIRLNTDADLADIGVHPNWVVGNGGDLDDHDKDFFSSPHSIAFHEDSATIIVADRDNFRLVVLDAETGSLKGTLKDCFGEPSSPSTAPWGVRVSGDLLYVAVCDSPETGKKQRIIVLDIVSLEDDHCNILETIPVDPELCLTPHELAVDDNGDVFLACVTWNDPNTGASASHVQRYRNL